MPSCYIDWSDIKCLGMFKRVPPTLGDLMEKGFDPFDDPDWDTLGWYQTPEESTSDPFSSAQMERFEVKFIRRYKPRLLGLYPPETWRYEFVRLLGEILPKFRVIFEALDRGADPLATMDTYGKDRNVYSEFPATQLDTSREDYARNARDREFETFVIGDFIEKVKELGSSYQDADAMLLDALEDLFDCFLPVDDDWYEWPWIPRICMDDDEADPDEGERE